MRRVLSFSLIGLLFFGVLVLTACSSAKSTPIYATDRVIVFINQGYEYLLEEEALEFDFDNLECINYNKTEVFRWFTLNYTANLSTWDAINERADMLKAFDFVKTVQKNAWDTSFRIAVKEEYFDKFDAEEFSLSDFEWSGASSLKYIHYSKTYFHEVTVMLKSHGQQKVQQAIEHIKNFQFVKGVRAIITEYTKPFPAFTHDTVNVVLTQEYTQPKNLILAPNDFNFANIGSVVYLTTHPNDISGYSESNKPNYRHIISIHLLECSEQHVNQAVEHISKLSFVQSAEPNHIMYGADD